MMPYPHKVVILRSGFRYADRPLLFGRAQLFFDRIELTGWHVAEHHAACLPLSAIRQVTWLDEGERRARAVLELQDGAALTLTFNRAGQWKRLLAQRLSWKALAARPFLPGGHAPTLGEVVAYASSFS